jgi:hypothetical protein
MVLMSMRRAWRALGWQGRGRRLQHGRVRPVQGTERAPGSGADDELPQLPEAPWGCGWFDSSLDLREGLAVIEHQGIELGLALELMFDVAPRPRTTLQASRPQR